MRLHFFRFGVASLLITTSSFRLSHGHGHEHEQPTYGYSSATIERSQHELDDDEVYSDELRSHSDVKIERPLSAKEREMKRDRLYQIWDNDGDDDGTSTTSESPVWFQALASTLLISVAPFLILFFVDVSRSEEHENRLRVMLSFASGGLLGDAFLHLIPHAMIEASASSNTPDAHLHSHGHSHSGDDAHSGHDLRVGLGVLGGIVAFLLVEKIVKIYCGTPVSIHSHFVTASAPSDGMLSRKLKESGADRSSIKKKDDDAIDNDACDNVDTDADGRLIAVASAAANSQTSMRLTDETASVQVAGYLNLFADLFHNFTDGLAIGVSFAAGKTVGIFTTLTVLLHEVPHEIGDYAILVKSGVPSMQAKLLQLVTAVGAVSGCVVALATEYAGHNAAINVWIMSFTAGGFIYIAAVSVLPQLIESKGNNVWQGVVEVSALLIGIWMMVLIARFE